MTNEKAARAHKLAIKYAVAHYEDDPQPRGSAILAFAEDAAAEVMSIAVAPGDKEAEREATVYALEHGARKALLFLRGETEKGAYRDGARR